MKVTVHANPNLNNQKIYSEYLLNGFSRIGYKACVTSERNASGDIHVVIGPHYAMLQNPGALYLDRCLWGDDMAAVTLGWLGPSNGMIYPVNAPDDRRKPVLLPWRTTEPEKVLYLFDYGPYPDQYLTATKMYPGLRSRPHPATGKPLPPLEEELARADLVIGHRTSALVTAAIAGVPVVSLDVRSPVYAVAGHTLTEIIRPDRTQWLQNMSYAQWTGEEIRSGEALKYVFDNRPDL